MIEFANQNPGYAFLIVWVVAWACVQPFRLASASYARRLRSKNIAAHGWPVAPIDADGDVVYEKKDDESRA